MIRRTLVLIGALALLSVPAFAICPDATTFGATQPACATATGLCGFQTPVAGHGAADVTGTFWSYTTGNPAFGIGNDNGSWPSTEWLFDTGDPAGNFVPFGTWAQDTRQDGCYTVIAPDPAARMIMAVADQDATGHSFLAVAAVIRTGFYADEFDFSLSRGAATTGQVITLRPLAAPVISGSVRNSATDRSVTLAPISAPTSLFYTGDSNILFTDIVKGFKVYRQDVPYANPAQPGPAPRGRAGWTAVGGVQAFGSSPTINVTCSTNVNVYLAYSLVFDGATTPFESDLVSANSAQPVACGPTLADPADRKFKVIPRK